MIKTIRDAESQINILTRELVTIKARIDSLKNQVIELENQIPSEVKSINEVDSIVAADGSVVNHRLLHKFENLKTENLTVENLEATNIVVDDLTVTGDLHIDDLEAETLDLRDSGPPPQIHISNDATDQGLYIMNLGETGYIIAGATWTGAAWIAKNTSAVLITFNGTETAFQTANGLTVGASVPWVLNFKIPAVGPPQLWNGPLAISDGGTAAGDIVNARNNLDAAKRGSYPVVGGGGGTVTIT